METEHGMSEPTTANFDPADWSSYFPFFDDEEEDDAALWVSSNGRGLTAVFAHGEPLIVLTSSQAIELAQQLLASSQER